MGLLQMRSAVPEGKSGDWAVDRFEIVDDMSTKLFNMRLARDGHGSRVAPPGHYTRLMRRRSVIMSDTPAELRDLRVLGRYARGHVLINGLGLGMAVQLCTMNKAVDRITVIEKSEDVIALVADHFRSNRIDVIHDDAFTFDPPKGVRFGAVWHDIWDNISPDNIDGMSRLHRKYGRRCDWQCSWLRDEVQRIRRRDRDEQRVMQALCSLGTGRASW